MRNRHLVVLALTAAVALLAAVPAFAQLKEGAVPDEDGAMSGVLTAVVMDLDLSGRAITSVSPTATAGSVLSDAIGAAILVDEFNATGVDGWYVGVQLDEDLSNGLDGGDEITYGAQHVTATAPAAVAAVALILNGTTGLPALQNPLDITASPYTDDDSTGMDDGSVLFSVSGQSASNKYTAAYTSSSVFTVDLTAYDGPAAVLTAPYTVTLYQ